MLTRQKLLLAILHYAARPLGRTRLVKLAFLLKKSPALAREPTFYDFVPYKYGPFSFALYREMDSLQRHGLVDWGETASLNGGALESASRKVDELPGALREAAFGVVKRYSDREQTALLKEVYAQHPWYATRSDRQDLVAGNHDARPEAPLAVYTMGYEGRSVDSFFDYLLREGIMAILDVRARPISRKYGFAKKSMSAIAEKLGVGYCHHPQVGIPSDKRKGLTDYASYQQLLESYEQDFLPGRQREISELAVAVGQRPSALVCMERDANWCHRSRLAKAVSKEAKLRTVHL